MRQKKKTKKRSLTKSDGKESRKKITPAGVIGMGIGLALMVIGLYQSLAHGENGGYYVVALGVLFGGAVCWGVFRTR